MTLDRQLVLLIILPIPIASIAWTVTHEALFREFREWCIAKSTSSRSLAARKFFEYRQGFGRASDRRGGAVQDSDAGLGCNVVPHLPRTACAPPRVRGLAGDGDITEVADGRAVRARVAVEHDDFRAGARRSQRVGKADDAGADHRKIERWAAGQRGAGRASGTDRNTPNSAAILQLTRA